MISAVVITICIIFCINACDYSYFDELPEYRLGPEFVVPLLYGSLSIEDIIKDSDIDYLEIDDDNFITVVAHSSTTSPTADQLLFLIDQFIPYSLPIELNPVQKTDTVIQTTFTANFNFGIGEVLDSLALNGGVFQFEVSEPQMATDGFQASITATIPKAYDKDGNPLTVSVNLNETATVSLDNVTFEFFSEDNGTKNSANNFDIDYTIHITGPGQSRSYTLDFDHTFQEFEFSGLYGDIMMIEFDLPGDTIAIPIYDRWEDGMISFADPMVILKADNSFGFMTHVHIDTLQAVNNNQQVPLETLDPVSITPWIIENAEYPGHSALSVLNLNRETSNLDDFINLPPKEVIYAMRGVLLSDDLTQGFILETSKLDFDIEIRLPLHISINNFILKESFSISPGDVADYAEKLELHMDITNKFPLDAILQFTFVDKNGNKLFTLFDSPEGEYIIASAVVNEHGEVVSPTNKESSLALTAQKIQMLKETESLEVRVKLQTAEQGSVPVKIYTHQAIDLKMTFQGKMSID